jgi:hypothetical protein
MGWPRMPSRFDKTHTFTVPADEGQAARWEAVAALQGQSVESWLADIADRYLKVLARMGRQPSLPWRTTYFRVLLGDREFEVRGIASDYFGIFRGDHRGLGEPASGRHSLVHLPCRRILKTLPLRKACMALAAELSALRINWQEKNPEKVLVGAPDQEKAQRLIRLFDGLSCPS